MGQGAQRGRITTRPWPNDPIRMSFLAALVIDGPLAGVVYDLVALAFVVVYKAWRMMNFALGEWLMLGSRLVAAASTSLGSGSSRQSGWPAP